MHSYEPAARLPYTPYVSGSLPAYPAPRGAGQQSPTPIYDTLYAEYRRAFRALPGDRLGEEDLAFTPFGIRELAEPRHIWERVPPPEPPRRHRRPVPRALPPAARDRHPR
ncbi:hypothetical protein [Streptomyces zingiberis]|uniref:Uncharacterized protein n=1 Tax=Streptomyces zingiberis TaxID=2053010 RepID=A0ABX1BW68_9ACTN|nr:hypothetical protein [Streptomyces zingiberis]NJQ01328.1 hypothetical protein [Streptomyces zingiberis]